MEAGKAWRLLEAHMYRGTFGQWMMVEDEGGSIHQRLNCVCECVVCVCVCVRGTGIILDLKLHIALQTHIKNHFYSHLEQWFIYLNPVRYLAQSRDSLS